MNLVCPIKSRKVSVPGVPRKVIGDDSTEFNRGQVTQHWDIKIRSWDFKWS